MPYVNILDPNSLIFPDDKTTINLLIRLGNALNAGERACHYKRVHVLGEIYSARGVLNGSRFVFAEHGDSLVLLASFNKGQHEQYERFLGSAAARYHKLVASGSLASASVIELTSPLAGPARAVPVCDEVADEVAIVYGSEIFMLNDQQKIAIQTRLPLLLTGPAGSGKTAVAYQLLQQLAASLSEDEARPILYLAPLQLVTLLSNLWVESGLEAAYPHRVQFKTVMTLAEELLPQHWRIGKDSFSNWYRSEMKAIGDMLRPVFKDFLKKKGRYSVGIKEFLYKEFKLIAEFIAQYPECWVETYEKSDKTYFSGGLKDSIVGFFKSYLASLERNNEIDPCLDAQRLNNIKKYYSKVVVDEAQVSLPPGMASLLSRMTEIAYCCDPHQDTLDGTLGFLRLLQGAGKISTIPLTSSYRCPAEVAKAAACVLDAKERLFPKEKKHGVATFTSMSDNDEGHCCWVKTENSLLAPDYSRSVDTAFVSFYEEDCEGITEKYKPLLNFLTGQEQGLEYDNIVIVNAWKLVEKVWRLEEKITKREVDTSTRDSVFQHSEEVRALNQLFVAITRAKRRVVFLDTDDKNKRLCEYARNLCGFSSVLPSPAGQIASSISSEEQLRKELDRLIESGNNDGIAREIWRLLGEDSQRFDGYRKEITARTLTTGSDTAAASPARAAAAGPADGDGAIASSAQIDLKGGDPACFFFAAHPVIRSWLLPWLRRGANRRELSTEDCGKISFALSNTSLVLADKKYSGEAAWSFLKSDPRRATSCLATLLGRNPVLLENASVLAALSAALPSEAGKEAGSSVWYYLASFPESGAWLITLKLELLIRPEVLVALSAIPPSAPDRLAGCSAWYFLAAVPGGRAWLIEFFRAKPGLLNNRQILAALSAIRPPEAGKQVGYSVWYLLALALESRLGLIELLNKKLTLLEDKQVLAAFSAVRPEAGEQAGYSVWYLLVVARDSRRGLVELLNKKPTLLEDKQVLAAFSAVRRPEAGKEAGYSVWYCLAAYPESRPGLINFLNTEPKLLKNERVLAALSAVRPYEAGNEVGCSAWYFLASHRESRPSLITLLQRESWLLSDDRVLNAFSVVPPFAPEEDAGCSVWSFLAADPVDKALLIKLLEANRMLLEDERVLAVLSVLRPPVAGSPKFFQEQPRVASEIPERPALTDSLRP